MTGDGEQVPTVYRFGAFELKTGPGELRKHGTRIELQDQPLQILLLLLEHAGELVTRERIQNRLWPPGTYVDYDNAINSAGGRLRGSSVYRNLRAKGLSIHRRHRVAPSAGPAAANPHPTKITKRTGCRCVRCHLDSCNRPRRPVAAEATAGNQGCSSQSGAAYRRPWLGSPPESLARRQSSCLFAAREARSGQPYLREIDWGRQARTTDVWPRV